MRCKPCSRAYCALAQLCRRDEKLRGIYVEHLRKKRKRLRSLAVRSHDVRPGNLWRWIKKELHAIRGPADREKRVPVACSSPKKYKAHCRPVSQDNDTGAAMCSVPAGYHTGTPPLSSCDVESVPPISSSPSRVNPTAHTARASWWDPGQE